ncbi:uncharacterized protein LOC119765518 isoform X1 [Culex quinquefasciatus]|uniref:Uncharacterized protein n=1 Tax=Culex quinquefasciatus TaxID=7176 RepID=A0A904MV79_CULQU|nr:uncharacterized protein LOC119765518 isoform X1 [Culex quinquefasciatus]
MKQLSKISHNITVITVVICAILHQCNTAPHFQHAQPPPLFESDSLWMNPCSMASYNNSFTRNFTKYQRAENLERIKNAIFRTRQEIEHITIESGENTDWNSKAEKYTFLEPYKKNQTTWEPRLQVYLASIQVIYLKQVDLDNLKNEDGKAGKKLEELRKQAKQLLCDIQEYRNISKSHEQKKENTGYTKEQMNSLIKFDVTEDSDMDLHKWFLKCRFRCFLNAMETHVDILYNRTISKTTRKVRTTKMPKKKPRKGKKNGKLLRNKCCIVNNKPSSPATPKPPMDRTHNNKKKHNERKQSKNIDQNQKKVQRKGNKKAAHKIQM